MNKKEYTESGNLRESNPPPMTGFQKPKSRQKAPKSTLPWGMQPVGVMEEIQKRGLDVSQMEIWQTINDFSSRESPAPAEPDDPNRDPNPSRGDRGNQSTKLGTPPPIPKRKLELLRDSALPANIPVVEYGEEDGPITIPAPAKAASAKAASAKAAPAKAAPAKAAPAKPERVTEKSSEPSEEPSSPDSRDTQPAPSPSSPQKGLAATVLMKPEADLELPVPKGSSPKSGKGVIIAISIVVPALLLAAATAFLYLKTDVVSELVGSPIKPGFLGIAPESKPAPAVETNERERAASVSTVSNPAVSKPDAPLPEPPPASRNEVVQPAEPVPDTQLTASVAAPSLDTVVGDPPPEPTAGTSAAENRVVITVTGLPKEAEVLVNGKPEQRQFSVTKTEKSVKVEARAPGYQSRVKRVVPTRDKRINLRLKRE